MMHGVLFVEENFKVKMVIWEIWNDIISYYVTWNDVKK